MIEWELFQQPNGCYGFRIFRANTRRIMADGYGYATARAAEDAAVPYYQRFTGRA